MIRALNIWLVTWSVFTILLSGASAAQAQEEKRVAVMAFEGPSAAAAHAQVTKALKQRPEIELVSAREMKSTAGRLGNSLASASDFREVGEALELSAIIEGDVAKRGRNLQINVRVRDASTGEVIHEETWTKRRSHMKTLGGAVWRALGPAISESSTPTKKPSAKPKPAPVEEPIAEEEEEPRPRPRPRPRREEVEEPPPPAEEEEEKRSSEPGDKSVSHPALLLALGPRIMWRTLSYDGGTNFSSYKSTDEGTPSFNLALSAQYYPGAHASSAWFSNFGLDLDLAYALFLKSQLGDKKLSTTAYDLGIGAIARVPLGDFELRFRAGYLKQVFKVNDLPEDIRLPAIEYSAVRIGAGAAIRFVEWLTFDASFAYLVVLGAGDLDKPEYGEDVRTRAWEAGAGFLLRFKNPAFGARAALDYRRYKYDFGLSDNPDLDLPKSGTDSYLRLTISFVYTAAGVTAK